MHGAMAASPMIGMCMIDRRFTSAGSFEDSGYRSLCPGPC